MFQVPWAQETWNKRREQDAEEAAEAARAAAEFAAAEAARPPPTKAARETERAAVRLSDPDAKVGARDIASQLFAICERVF